MKTTLEDVPFVGMYSYGEILDGKNTLSVVSMMVEKRFLALLL